MRKTLEERFWEKVDKRKSNECWLWQGHLMKNGYGTFSAGTFRDRHKLAHRVSWELSNNRIVPKGLCILHSCDVRNCVNPNHLRTGTIRDNVLDAIRKKRRRPNYAKAATTYLRSCGYTVIPPKPSIFIGLFGSDYCSRAARKYSEALKHGI